MSYNPFLGIHGDALNLRAQRAELLANNLASASVPGYKARDIDFYSVLANETANQTAGAPLTTTDQNHVASLNSSSNPQLLYRVPNQPSLDGNTVDPDLEYKAFLDNSLHYQMSLTFLRHKVQGVMQALGDA